MAEFQPSVEPGQLPGRAYPNLPAEVSPQDFGSDIGQGLQQAAQHVFAEQLNASRAQVTGALTQVDSGSESLLRDPEHGALTLERGAAFNLSARYGGQFDAVAKEARAQIVNPAAQKQFDLALPARRNRFQTELDNHELQQRHLYTDDTFKAHIDTQAQLAAQNYKDPTAVAGAEQEIIASVQNRADLAGIGKDANGVEVRGAMLREELTKLHTGVIGSMLAVNDFATARKYVTELTNAKDPDGNLLLDGKQALGLSREVATAETMSYEREHREQNDRWRANSVGVLSAFANGKWQNGKPFTMTDIARTDTSPEFKDSMIRLVMAKGDVVDDPAAVNKAWGLVSDVYKSDDINGALESGKNGILALDGLSNKTKAEFQQRLIGADVRSFRDPEFSKYVSVGVRRITGTPGGDLSAYVGFLSRQRVKKLGDIAAQFQEDATRAHHSGGPGFDIGGWYDQHIPDYLQRVKELDAEPDEPIQGLVPTYRKPGDPKSGVDWDTTIADVKRRADGGQWGYGPDATVKAADALRQLGYTQDAGSALKAAH